MSCSSTSKNNQVSTNEISAYDLLDNALNSLEKLEAEHEQLKIENETLRSKISQVENLRLEEVNALKSELNRFTHDEKPENNSSRRKLFLGPKQSVASPESFTAKQTYKSTSYSYNKRSNTYYNSRVNGYIKKLSQYYYDLALHNYKSALQHKLLLESSKRNSATTTSGRCFQETTTVESALPEKMKDANVHPESDLNRSFTDLSVKSDTKEVCQQPKRQQVKVFHVTMNADQSCGTKPANEASTNKMKRLPIWRKENANNWNHDKLEQSDYNY